MGVIKLGFAHVRVTDLAEAVNHYSNTLGQTLVTQADGKAYLKAWDEFDHHSVVLEEGGVGLVKLGYKVETEDDLTDIEHKAQRFGATTERGSKGDNLAIGDTLRITIPSGHTVELYNDIEYSGTDVGVLNPDPWPRDARGAAVHRLDHSLITAEDPLLAERFFGEVLGMRASERLVTDPANPELIGTWMYCNQKAHDIAVIKGEDNKLHHFAYWLDDWSEILRAGDVLSMDDVPVDVGPTRHGITRGKTIYFFDPSGNRNEVFSGGYITGPDFPTITWTADHLDQGIFYIGREVNERFTTVVT